MKSKLMSTLHDLISGQYLQPQLNPLRDLLTQPIDLMALIEQRAGATGNMRTHNPSLREKIGNLVYDAASGGGMKSTANRMRNEAMGIADFVPVLDSAIGIDDAANDYNSGNYGMAAAGLGLTAAGAFPIVGPAAAKVAKKIPYHRFTPRANPDNGRGYMMFAHGDPERVNVYGSHHWGLDPDDFPDGSIIDASNDEIRRELSEVLSKNWDEIEEMGYYYTNPDDLADLADPSDIVNSAGVWDSDLVELIWEKFLEPRGALGVKTSDGFIAFDPQYVRSLSDGR